MAVPAMVPTAPSSAALVTRLVTLWLAVMRLAGDEASKMWLGRSCKCLCQPACNRRVTNHQCFCTSLESVMWAHVSHVAHTHLLSLSCVCFVLHVTHA